MLKDFLKMLAKKESSETVYNQYQDENILNNLSVYLEWLLSNNPKVLVIGEAPGYKGCRITGIPFTSGEQIKRSQHKLFLDIGNKITLNKMASESTATIFWNFIGKDRPVPILWNSFPFHPYEAHNPDTNRRPTSKEIEIGRDYLEIIYDLFKPTKLYSLGRCGERSLKETFPTKDIRYIRHPSYGGGQSFKNGMEKVLRELQ